MVPTDAGFADTDPKKASGATLLFGFVLVVLLLYRDPAAGFEAAGESAQSILYFVVLPVAGLLAGGYAILDGPYGSVSVFLLGSYLGIVGLWLILGTLLSSAPNAVRLGLAVVVLLSAVLALFGSILQWTRSLHFGPIRTPEE